MLEPVLAAHLLLVPPAIALDTWCALRRPQARPEAAHWGGALLYSGVFFAVALPYIARLRLVPSLNTDGQITAIAIGVPAALIAGIVFARIATWLGHLGEVPAEEPAPRGASGARSV